jgi:hypothetical protein
MERIVIKHLSGSKANQEVSFPLDQVPEISLGRDAASTVAYDMERDDAVSRNHARITRDPARRARSSSSPTWAAATGSSSTSRGSPAAQPLHHGDLVQLGTGGPEFSFQMDPPPALTPKGDAPDRSPAGVRPPGRSPRGQRRAPRHDRNACCSGTSDRLEGEPAGDLPGCADDRDHLRARPCCQRLLRRRARRYGQPQPCDDQARRAAEGLHAGSTSTVATACSSTARGSATASPCTMVTSSSSAPAGRSSRSSSIRRLPMPSGRRASSTRARQRPRRPARRRSPRWRQRPPASETAGVFRDGSRCARRGQGNGGTADYPDQGGVAQVHGQHRGRHCSPLVAVVAGAFVFHGPGNGQEDRGHQHPRSRLRNRNRRRPRRQSRRCRTCHDAEGNCRGVFGVDGIHRGELEADRPGFGATFVSPVLGRETGLRADAERRPGAGVDRAGAEEQCADRRQPLRFRICRHRERVHSDQSPRRCAHGRPTTCCRQGCGSSSIRRRNWSPSKRSRSTAGIPRRASGRKTPLGEQKPVAGRHDRLEVTFANNKLRIPCQACQGLGRA